MNTYGVIFPNDTRNLLRQSRRNLDKIQEGDVLINKINKLEIIDQNLISFDFSQT